MHRRLVFGRRRAGILLHPTSLPGPGPAGTLAGAAEFLDLLAEAGCTVWQVLPLLPVNHTLSPYQPLSLFAGNPALIDPAALAGELERPVPNSAEGAEATERLVQQAVADVDGLPPPIQHAWKAFHAHHAEWLEPWCVFAAARERFDGRSWHHWPGSLREFHSGHLDSMYGQLSAGADCESFRQFVFHRQWRRLKADANARGIALFGDLPFYPATDSSDIWAGRALFALNTNGYPARIAGVPPDAFSEIGQDWGCPVYDWNAHRADGFAWWRARLARQAELFDILRIDHFRGLQAYWSFPAGALPLDGDWHPAPGREMLDAVARHLGPLPLVAEDLGTITPEVERLRRDIGLPGMRVLQFGFEGGDDNPHHPSNHEPDCVVYTGTHDNDTIVGWWQSLSKVERTRVLAASNRAGEPPQWRIIRLALDSPGRLAVVPMQDVLGLGSKARMNTPATVEGNWRWRLAGDEPLAGAVCRFAALARESGR